VKDEAGAEDNFYYIFVKLNNFAKDPDFWVIPSKIVCPLLKQSDELWLKSPGRNNSVHNGSTMRILPIEVRKSQLSFYPENWNEEVKKYYKNLEQLI
jgi:ADP-ribosylglycohydrolase